MENITQNELKQCVLYNPYNGVFKWKVYQGKAREGDSLGYEEKNGYLRCKINGKRYFVHRLVFLYQTGVLPSSKEQVDHINHTRDDNRWSNLRLVSGSGNSKNRSIYTSHNSGVFGVRWNTSAKKWHAQIGDDGKGINLGLFNEFSEAVNARKNAEVLYGYHENHGQK